MLDVLSPHRTHHNMYSEPNNSASPLPQARRQQPKQSRQHQHHQAHEVLSDSNLPSTATPKSRKTPRHNQHADRSASLAVHNNHHAHTGSNQRHRPASVAVPQGNPTTTPSKPSYAGAAFHASPAPSSLPVPKFFSKSVPSANAEAGLQAEMEREGDRSDSNDVRGARLAPPPSRSEVKSPLEMFFSADRQEKARLQPGGSASPSTNSRSETPNRSRDMFMLELDEASSPVTSDHHSTPSAARRYPPADPSTLTPEQARRAEQTQSLKSFLNITGNQASGTSPSQVPRHLSPQQQSPFATPSNQVEHDPNLHYGNKKLSTLFQAARSPSGGPSPQQTFSPAGDNVGPYGSVHTNTHASPSRPGPPPVNTGQFPVGHYPPANVSRNYTQASPAAPSSMNGAPWQGYSHSQSSRSGPTESSNDVKEMEDRMKRMLRMS